MHFTGKVLQHCRKYAVMLITCACISLLHVFVGQMLDSDVYSLCDRNIMNMKQILYSLEIIIDLSGL